MRVRYGELSAAERAALAAIREQARALWTNLAEHPRKYLSQANAALAHIDQRLFVCVNDERPQAPVCLALSASESDALPLAELILSEAPSDFPAALQLGRSPCELETALAEVADQYGVSLARASLRAGFGRGHLLDVTLGVRGGSGGDHEQAAAEWLVRRVLGDRLFETWVGAVHATPAPRLGSLRVLAANTAHVELEVADLFATVTAAARGLLLGLPDVTHARLPDTEDWTLLEVEPLDSARGVRKDDLVLASSRTPELLRCFLDGAPCSSRRFSRTGEIFLYLGYADPEPSADQRVACRARVEACIGEALGDDGAVVGAGLGLRTTYVDLAISEISACLPRLVNELREQDLPEQSFIRFFDSELAQEWLSIWPHVNAIDS